MKPLLSVIIASYNTKKLTLACVDSLLKDPSGLPMEIIVVDNGSSDGTLEVINNLKLKIKNLRLIQNKTNMGFAKAHNQGMKISKGEYFLNLDSDISAKPGSIRKLLDFAKSKNDGAVFGGKLVNPDESNQPSVRNLPTLQGAFKEYWFGVGGAFEFYSVFEQSPMVVGVVRGACFLIPRKITNNIGFFNEKYFLYFEEIDYCRKAVKAGFKIYYVPDAEFIHHIGASGKIISDKTKKWLIESSKLYHGLVGYYLLTIIIWLGQKWQNLLGTKR